MSWTVQNVSADSVAITDTPIPISWAPGQVQSVPMADFLYSAQLSQAIQNLQLVVTQYGTFQPLPRFAPLTLTLLGTNGATGLVPVTLTQNGQSPPITCGPFTTAQLLINVSAVGTSGGSLAFGLQTWDGAAYYPVQALGSTLSAVGLQTVSFTPPLLAARVTWTVSGSVTVTTLCQLQ